MICREGGAVMNQVKMQMAMIGRKKRTRSPVEVKATYRPLSLQPA